MVFFSNRGGTRSNNENVTKDGRTILCEWYNTPLIDTRNEVIGVASLVMDITERNRAEIGSAVRVKVKYPKELSQEFHTLLDAIDDPMIQLSPELKILWANRSAATFSGKDIFSLQGQYCYKLWFNRSGPCEDCPTITKCFQEGENR